MKLQINQKMLTVFQDCNLPMEEGEELILLEDDCEGWTRVRRLQSRPDEVNEGYVPSSYIRIH